jgi:hypothetical protein
MASNNPHVMPNLSAAGAPVTNSVANTPDGVTTNNPGLTGFPGEDAVLSQQVNGYDVEPPDQGLCVGGGYVMEVINLVWAVYTPDGTVVAGPQDANGFFGEDPAVFTSDPKCYYDARAQRWIVTILATDLFAGNSYSQVDVAVSKTSDPAGPYYHYKVDDTFSGQGGCPCVGDQPLIGADAYGFYIDVNAFDFNSLSYKGSSIYALSLKALENGKFSNAVHVPVPNQTPSGARPASLQPAESPTGQFQSAEGGTEYFMSGNSANSGTQHAITVWALSGTSSLARSSPSLTLSAVSLRSETYGRPSSAPQENGPLPNGNSLGFTSPSVMQTDDQRMNQVVYTGGQLWGALNTDVNGQPGIAWFVVGASGGQSSLSAGIANQGFLTGAGNLALAYPSFGVNGSGRAVMAFDASGPSNYPSVGYVTMTATGSPGLIHIASAGPAPDDGDTCYIKGYGGCRWGDYTATAPASDGSVWFAGMNTTSNRDVHDNWGTFIGNVTP